jgi:WD40 repeat protein
MFDLPSMKSQLLIIGPLLFSLVELSASPEKPNLEDDVMPIFESKCNSCHNADRAKGGLDLTNMNAILVGGSSGESVISGDGENSYLYKLIARIEKPYMPQREDKIPQPEIDLIKKWIDLGLLPSANGKPIQKKKSTVNLALGNVNIGKPEGPPPMPKYLSLEPSVVTSRAFASPAITAAPWSPLVAIAGQKQVLLYNTETLNLMGVLPYPEGFIESLAFSRNGKLIIAGGGRGGKSGRVVAWEVESGKRLLTMGEEYDTILSADLSPDQSLVAIGSPSKLIKVYDVASNEILYEIKKHSEWVTQVAFSPDGVLLATADRNGGLHIWEAQTGNPFYSLDGHKEEITDLSWRADSNVLASASEEGAVRTWEMNNGKQVKTWNAHGDGTLSIFFDSKGNIVTSGRDKMVKLWKGDGQAIRTIKDFKDIVMEVCYSFDGSRVIAGDWTGHVSIWNSSTGKKIADLSANPPELETRVKLAVTTERNALTNLEIARSTLKPSIDLLAQTKITLEQNQKTALTAEENFKKITATLELAKKMLEQAKGNVANKGKERTDKQNAKNEKSKALAQSKQNLLNKKKSFDQLNQQINKQSKELSRIRDAHSQAQVKLKENPDDSNYSKSFTKHKDTLVAMENSLLKTRDQANKQKIEIDAFSKLIQEQTNQLTEAGGKWTSANQAYNSSLEEQKKSNLAWQENNKLFNQQNADKAQANVKLTQSQKAFEKAQNDIKKPKEELALAEKTYAQTQKDSARWDAEIINVERHVELRNSMNLQNELDDFQVVLSSATQLKNSALQAFENARDSLSKIPEEIIQSQEMVTQKKSAVIESEKRKVSVMQTRDQKNKFISEVSHLATLALTKSEAKEPNSTFGKASEKFQETLTLLKKDLAETENQLAGKEQELHEAHEAVRQAEKKLEETIKLKESAPLLSKEKEAILAEANAKESITQKDFELLKTKVDQQSVKAEALLKKYLELRPQ